MKKNELKKFERELVWECFERRIPELLFGMEDLAEEIEFSGAEYDENETWKLKGEHGAIVITSTSEGVLEVLLMEPCHKMIKVVLVDPMQLNEVDHEAIVTDISTLCKVFVVGNWHVLMDYVCGADNWKIALEAYLVFEDEHPEILVPVTYVYL